MKARNYTTILLHTAFWVGLFTLLNSEALDLEWGPFSREKGTFRLPLIYGMIINLILLYGNIYWMIPRFLHKKRQKQFWIITVISVLFLSLTELFIDLLYLIYLSDFNPNLIIDNYENLSKGELRLDIIIWLSSILIINLFYWSIAFLYRFPDDWKKNERAKQQLIQDKLTAELDFLKSQINPHFLFNGINSIYHLIGINDDEARKVLLQFSELLRYQLYECDDEYILLKNELNYVKNYIFLEKVRKGQDAIMVVNLPTEEILDTLHGLKIAPLLLTPFLENTFKYLSNYSKKEDNQLTIQISVVNEELVLYAENTIDTFAVNNKRNKKSSGIGLENVRRRLSMLYQDKHALDITKEDNKFKVSLKIKLS